MRLARLGIATLPLLLVSAEAASAATPASIVLEVEGLKKGTVQILGKATVRGKLSPSAAGEKVTVFLLRGGRVQRSRTAEVRSGGRFAERFHIDEDGRWRFRAIHEASASVGAATARSRRFAVRYPQLRRGDRGPEVKLLNRLLQKKGYTAPDSSRYNDTTGRGVMAFRKVNRLRRTASSASPRVLRTLVRGGGGYSVQHPGAGRHAEVSLRRQILVLADGGDVHRIHHVSTGTSSTPTVRGQFRFYRREPGYNGKRMYYSLYFHRGYAIHGFKDVPTHPASHGCVRTPIPEQRAIYRWLQLGDRIFVR